MSILIKGMEMPKNCAECFVAWERCHRTVEWYKNNPQYYDIRHEDCPLVEVPTPHGRLIDAEKLERDIEEYHLSDGKFQYWVQVQNSIIEAEEGEAHEQN